MGPRSFAVSGPTLWNSLPVELKLRKSHWNLLSRNSELTYLQKPMISDHRGASAIL